MRCSEFMKNLKVIVVGIGKQASEVHIPALLASASYELVGLIEKDTNKHHEIKRQYGVKCQNTPEKSYGLLLCMFVR